MVQIDSISNRGEICVPLINLCTHLLSANGAVDPHEVGQCRCIQYMSHIRGSNINFAVDHAGTVLQNNIFTDTNCNLGRFKSSHSLITGNTFRNAKVNLPTYCVTP